MKHTFRFLVGCAALAIGLAVVTRADAQPAAAPELPTESVKKAADADIKFIQDRLAALNKLQQGGGKLLDGQIKPALGVALLLAAYGDSLGDANLSGEALKIVKAIDGKDFKAADALAQKLVVKPAKGKAGALPKPLKDDKMLEAIMSPYRGTAVGGLGIDKDIKEMTKNAGAMKIDPAHAEVLAVRSAFINSFAINHPNTKANENAKNKADWARLSKDAVDLSKKVATETAKGNKFDEKATKGHLTGLLRSCNDCHEKFRDE